MVSAWSAPAAQLFTSPLMRRRSCLMLMHHRFEMQCYAAHDWRRQDPCTLSITLQPGRARGRSESRRTEFAELVHVRSPRSVKVLRLPGKRTPSASGLVKFEQRDGGASDRSA